MRRLICCDYHEESESVELRYTDGTLIDIDCLGVEDALVQNMHECSELSRLLRRDPLSYADLILNGDIEDYLHWVTDYRPLDEREY